MIDSLPYSRRAALHLLGGTMLYVPLAACGEDEAARVLPAAPALPGPAPTPGPTPGSTATSAADLRPRYHIAAPPGGWINDPQRPIRTADGWALWALFNPTYPDGGTSWRRWTSTDLVTWRDRGVSIPRNTTSFGDVWTGSTVRDTDNTSGFGAGAIVALATMPANNAAGQNQSCALWYSLDEGASFTFHEIVLPNYPGNKPFRDPTIFWHEPTRRWILTLSEEGKIGIYTSPDLKSWSYASGFLSDLVGSVMECSHLFQLHLYDDQLATSSAKWVLLVGGNGTALGFTVGTYYWVGEFDGATFTADDTTGQWLDNGADFYAAVVWTDPHAADPIGSAYTIGWMSNWDYANQLPTNAGYRGQLSIVRQLWLRRNGELTHLCSMPLAEQNLAFPRAVRGSDQFVSAGTDYAWPSGAELLAGRIDMTLTRVDDSWPTGLWLSVRGGGGYFTQIGFQLRDNAVFLKRDTSGPDAPNVDAWRRNRTANCNFNGGTAKISLFVDAGSIEIFVNDGAAVLSELITSPAGSTELRLNVAGGSIRVSEVTIWA
ncbi:levanbiose-producing levanase [Sphingomonas zeicaulis]|uniref:glycoside hydrolase family 32 protein n=1 Tax=Sphingomonas zeicaulis TaxID=1632740 RepID=UPI003D1C7585